MAGNRKLARLRAPERFTVEAVAEVFVAGRDRLEAGKSLRVDLSDVMTIDTAALQCLVVLRRAALEGGHGWAVVGAPVSVLQAANLLGLDRLLELE